MFLPILDGYVKVLCLTLFPDYEQQWSSFRNPFSLQLLVPVSLRFLTSPLKASPARDHAWYRVLYLTHALLTLIENQNDQIYQIRRSSQVQRLWFGAKELLREFLVNNYILKESLNKTEYLTWPFFERMKHAHNPNFTFNCPDGEHFV